MGEHESGGRRMSVLAVCSSLQSIPARGGRGRGNLPSRQAQSYFVETSMQDVGRWMGIVKVCQ